MSGYLHRLATGVLQPASGMHPVVDSLWSRPRSTGIIELTEEVLAAPAQQNMSLHKSEVEHPKEQQSERSAVESEAALKPSFALKPLIEETLPARQPRHQNQPAQPAPLVVTATPTRRQELHGPKRSTAQQSPAHMSRQNPIRPQQHAQTRPDEIEIHIGRIEVTAAPPLPPRPTPPPPRKALELGEYLRRSRRTR